MSTTTLPLPATREPAWARLPKSLVAKDVPSASAGFEQLGNYPVELVPIYTQRREVVSETLHRNHYTQAEGKLAIQRMDTKEIFDVVGHNYTILQPANFASLLDRYVPDLPLAGFCHLKGGRQQLAIYTLPGFDVRGDEIGSNLIIVNEMSGKRAVKAMIGNLRMICTNGQVHYDTNGGGTIVHDKRLVDRFIEWIQYLPRQAQGKNKVMAEVYKILATRPLLGMSHPSNIIDDIYPLPKDPPTFGPIEEIREAERRYELARDRVVKIRGEALTLYQGAGTGMDHPACAGTAWGLLQAITELEEYRPGRLVAESNLVGERQATKQRAYHIICDAIGLN